jgi:hypothetical protein
VALTHVSEETLEAQFAGASNPLEETYAAIMLAIARGLVVVPPPAIELLPGRLTTVREHVVKVLKGLELKGKEIGT